jgi:hypothetical protein
MYHEVLIDGISYSQQYQYDELKGCMQKGRDDSFRACDECDYMDGGDCQKEVN